jgi:GDP/UDP-N,N'-diacetylbacillosamine 2-epimerase (hydrolysing)
MDEVLKAIEHFPEIKFIITKANADAGGRYINEKLEEFVKLHNNCHLFSSLGIKRYISLLKGARAIVGNSSSGIVEAPIFNLPTVNIGDRQKGRLMAGSIINCNAKEEAVVSSISFALSDEGVRQAKESVSPYESGDTSVKIVEEIIRYLNNPNHSVAKKFYDVNFEKVK